MFPIDYKVEGDVMADPFHIEPGMSIYFRCSPQLQDWINILLLRFLREINIMYTTEKANEYKLRETAKHIIAEKTGKFGYYMARVGRIFKGIFDYAILIAMILA